MNDPTHYTLLWRVQHREPDAQSEFDRTYREPMLRIAQARGLQHADADDVVEHVLVRCYEDLAGYDRRRGRFSSHLCTFLRCRCVDRLRSKGDAQPVSTDVLNGVPDFAEQKQRDREEGELRAAELRAALDRLRSRYFGTMMWEAFERHHLNGRPYATIAAELQTSEAAARKASSRMMEFLREELGGPAE